MLQIDLAFIGLSFFNLYVCFMVLHRHWLWKFTCLATYACIAVAFPVNDLQFLSSRRGLERERERCLRICVCECMSWGEMVWGGGGCILFFALVSLSFSLHLSIFRGGNTFCPLQTLAQIFARVCSVNRLSVCAMWLLVDFPCRIDRGNSGRMGGKSISILVASERARKRETEERKGRNVTEPRNVPMMMNLVVWWVLREQAKAVV